MMHQRVDPTNFLQDRPDRVTLIDRDEILSLIIDLQVLTTEEIYTKYFLMADDPEKTHSAPRRRRRHD